MEGRNLLVSLYSNTEPRVVNPYRLNSLLEYVENTEIDLSAGFIMPDLINRLREVLAYVKWMIFVGTATYTHVILMTLSRLENKFGVSPMMEDLLLQK